MTTENLWRVPDDVIWALGECHKRNGFMPNAESTAQFLSFLEGRGFVRRADSAPFWHITETGLQVLTGDRDLSQVDLTALDTFQRAMT